MKAFDVTRTTTAFSDGDAVAAYAATVRAEAALRTRRVTEARGYIDDALAAFPKFAVRGTRLARGPRPRPCVRARR